ncbi:hypothetical protein AB0L06_32630 [Spirillospora sp. NPDC052269]
MRTTILGYPRIGANRELKFATEKYWAGRADAADAPSSPPRLPTRRKGRPSRPRAGTS